MDVESKLYYQKLPKSFLDSLKIPRLYFLITWLTVFIILLVGGFLSYASEDWMWFARFGALIVIVSLLIEASGVVQKYIDKIICFSAALTEEIVKMQVLRQPHMYGLTGNESEDEIDQITKKEHAQRMTNINLVLERKISSDVRRMQFLIGFVGTIVWGFGDLMGKLFAQ